MSWENLQPYFHKLPELYLLLLEEQHSCHMDPGSSFWIFTKMGLARGMHSSAKLHHVFYWRLILPKKKGQHINFINKHYI